MPSLRIAQLCLSPAVARTKRPLGALSWPLPLLPQQASSPLSRIAQAWYAPDANALKLPGGAGVPAMPPPQQASVPFERSPQLCCSPALSASQLYAGTLVALVPL